MFQDRIFCVSLDKFCMRRIYNKTHVLSDYQIKET
jgi:hypothetical protein